MDGTILLCWKGFESGDRPPDDRFGSKARKARFR